MFLRFLAVLTLSSLLIISGCSNNSTDPIGTTTNDLESDYGGYTSSDEDFGFDDPTVIAASTDDAAFDDPMLSNAAVDTIINDTETGRYHMRILWGQLRYDSTVTTVTDWTGSLSITRGAEVLKRIIHWELNQDFILERTDRTLIEWISKTTVHNDGIAVDLLIPPVRPEFDSSFVWVTDSLGDSSEVIIIDTIIPVVEPVEVTFTTGPYSRTFTLPELEKLDTIVYLEDSNAVAFRSLKMDRRACPAGFTNGFWGYNEKGEGVFRGLWIDETSRVAGFVKGHFGVNDNGEKVLFGKYVNRAGTFEGFIVGTYEVCSVNSSDSCRSDGKFQAQIYNQSRIQIGVLEGKFRSADDWTNGYFQGRWKNRCRVGGNGGPDDSDNDGL